MVKKLQRSSHHGRKLSDMSETVFPTRMRNKPMRLRAREINAGILVLFQASQRARKAEGPER
jgi:hypothetical protein